MHQLRCRLPIGFLLGAAAVVTIVLVVGRWGGAYIVPFVAWVRGLGGLGALVFVAGYALACILAIPGSLLTLAAGATFGLTRGIVLVFIGATLGASAAFFVSRYVARGIVERQLHRYPRLEAVNRAIGDDGRRMVFLLRLSPVFPFSLLNYALGVSKVRFVDFLVASAGMLPGTMLYVYYGKVAGDVAGAAAGTTSSRGVGYYALLALGLVATIVVTAFITRAARSSLDNHVTTPDSKLD
ncbi:MAG: TVP38/TMEM64 family protein [Phycisphaerae bacterium]|nr:TVP38/TMEM64 family protein [Gemmatimonadaceae bacterium]